MGRSGLGYLVAFLTSSCAAGRVLQTVVISRHGIRTPYRPDGKPGNLTREALAPYTTQDLPVNWPPGPGSDLWGTTELAQMTPNGAKNIQNMGAWMGSANFSDVPCEHVANYADFGNSRDNDTAIAWMEGAFPNCPGLHQKANLLGYEYFNALFDYGQDVNGCPVPPEDVIDSIVGGSADNYAALRSAWGDKIEKLDSVADCCSDSVCGGTPCNMSTLPMHFDGKPWAATSGSFAVATYFATFFLMEALNGHPTFAQGKLSLEEVVQLFSVNSGGLEQMDNAFTAKSWASTLLSYVLASFDQTAMASPIPGLLHSPETEVVFMAGHDTNVMLMSKLLDMPYLLDGWFLRSTHPGIMLIFELHRESTEDGDVDTVQAFWQSASPQQMRDVATFTEEAPPVRHPAFIPGCGSAASPERCLLGDFGRLVRQLVAPECITISEIQRYILGGDAEIVV